MKIIGRYAGEPIAHTLDEQCSVGAHDRNRGKDFRSLELYLSRVCTERTRRDPRQERARWAALEAWTRLGNTGAQRRVGT